MYKNNLFLILLICTPIIIKTNPIEEDSTELTKACPSIDDLFDPTSCPLPPDEPLRATTGDDCFDAAMILNLITPGPDSTPVINAPNILKEDLYLHTTGPVRIRSLLDEPSLQTYNFDNDYISLVIEPFYNYTPKVFFTKNSPFLKSYIDLNNNNIINELSLTQAQAQDLLNRQLDADIPGILGLFNNIKLQQHRVGFMVGVCKQFSKFIIDFRVPFYYLLEHFFLTNPEIDRIKNNPFFTSEGSTSAVGQEDNVKRFLLKHLVSDRMGFGDSRLTALFNFWESSCAEFWAGIQVTIPTAQTVLRPILGGRFDSSACPPAFNIKRLFNLAFCGDTGSPQQVQAHATIQQDLSAFLVGALDRLSTILINTPLGNGRHWGVGPQFDFRYQFNDYWGMHTYAAFEWFSKHNERRFFLIKKNPAEFDRDYRNEAQAEANLAFLNQQIINTLYPTGVTMSITPGYIVKLRHSFMYDTRHWHASIGFDYWRQDKDKFGAICQSPVPECALNFEKGIRPVAQQGKIFGAFGYYGTAFCHRVSWYTLLCLDGTVFNTGIGKNYTLGIKIGLDF